MTFMTLAQRHPLPLFFLLAFAASWAVMVPLALSAQNILPPLPYALHYLSAYGPMLAALMVTALAEGRDGLRELAGRMLQWQVGSFWIGVAVLSPLALYALGAIAAYWLEGRWPDVAGLGRPNFLPDLSLVGALLLWIFNSGIGEETGWRGFALPRLQKNRSALAATLILGAIWALWHVPAFFYLPSYAQLGVVVLPGFVLGVISGAIVLTWLYNSTRGSILMLILWHGIWNFLTAPPVSGGTAAAVTSTLVMVWAVLIVIVFKPTRLSRAAKQVR